MLFNRRVEKCENGTAAGSEHQRLYEISNGDSCGSLSTGMDSIGMLREGNVSRCANGDRKYDRRMGFGMEWDKRSENVEKTEATGNGKSGRKISRSGTGRNREDVLRAMQESHALLVKNRALCEWNVRYGHKPCYLYLFDHDLPGDKSGSFHSSELWYVFGTITRCWRPMTGIDYDISRVMTKSWANFAKRKDPNGEGVPEWKPYQSDDAQNMVFSEKTECKKVNETEVQKYLKEIMLERT